MITSPAKPSFASISTLRSIKPRPVAGNGAGLVRTGTLTPGQRLPLVVTPALDGIDLIDWARANYAQLLDWVAGHGGVLFRGFSAAGQADFERFVQSIPLRVAQYVEGATPRTKLSKDVYTSTEFSADQSIAPHNELSYVKAWPTKIIFFCETPPTTQGETPIADCARVFERIPAAIRDAFCAKGWMLKRNYGDGLGLPWQRAFRTDSRTDVENYLRDSDIQFEWLDEDGLRTTQVRSPILRHPTGRTVWFNHIAFWNIASLAPAIREPLQALYKDGEYPYNTYYGDGTPIRPEVIEEINGAYEAETIKFTWQKGDLLFLDNTWISHARSPFTGPRRILTAMGDASGDRGL